MFPIPETDMPNHAETARPPTPSSSSPGTPHRPLPALPASGLPLSTRRPTKSNRVTKTNLEPVMEGDGRLTRDIHSPPPGDVRGLGRKASGPELSKKRSQYFEDAFRSKHPAEEKERVSSLLSTISVDVKTNVFIADEFSFITDLAAHLSNRYNHPPSHIAISLQHGACLHLGGTFDPAYTIAIHAPPSQLQPATNRRNVALLQSHMEEVMRVGPSRGFVRFVAISEECSGWRGNTIAGAWEKERDKDKGAERNGVSEQKDEEESPVLRRRAMRSLSLKRSKASEGRPQNTNKATRQVSDPITGMQEGGETAVDEGDSRVERRLRKKTSFMHSLFGKAQRGEA